MLSSLGVVVEQHIDVVEEGAGLGFYPFALRIPELGLAVLAAAQAQALASPAEGELDGGEDLFIGLFGARLARYFHYQVKVNCKAAWPVLVRRSVQSWTETFI